MAENHPASPDFENKKPIAESKLKGLGVAHNIELGNAQKTDSRIVYDTEFVDGIDRPFAVFKYKYRSRSALQSMLLIQRSPTPVPLEERPVEELNIEELRELAQRQRANTLPDSKAKIEPHRNLKWERDAEYDELLASASTKKAKRPRPFVKMEVVDLSKDD